MAAQKRKRPRPKGTRGTPPDDESGNEFRTFSPEEQSLAGEIEEHGGETLWALRDVLEQVEGWSQRADNLGLRGTAKCLDRVGFHLCKAVDVLEGDVEEALCQDRMVGS